MLELPVFLLQPLLQPAELGGLAGTVGSFDYD
jgi:hypothetical protein